MELKEVFEKLKPLLEKLAIHRKTGVLSFDSINQKLDIRLIYRVVHPTVNVDLSCTTCVLQYLNVLLSWYEREYPKYLKSIAGSEKPIPKKANKKKAVNEKP